MLNVQDLERRWLKHKIKSKTTLVVSILGVTILLITTSIYLASSQETTNEEVDIKTLKKKSVEVVEHTQTVETQEEAVAVMAIPPVKQNQETSTLVLKPSLHFMDSIEDNISPYLDDESSNKVSSHQETTPSPRHAFNSHTNTQKKINTPVQATKDQTLVTRSIEQDNSDLKDVIKRFKKNKNPILGLFIAKRYYDAGEYQKSYNYALITNEIDKNIEESWIIFSKSLVKLGQKNLAINTLKSYLKTTRSTKAITLLQKIKSGEFK